MWLFTVHGFYSAVVDRDDPAMLHVRARDTRPLQHLCEWARRGGEPAPAIVTIEGADYRFRVRISRYKWTRFLAHTSGTMTAENFKSEVAKTVGHSDPYVAALHRVWTVMRAAFVRDVMIPTPETFADVRPFGVPLGCSCGGFWQEGAFVHAERCVR